MADDKQDGGNGKSSFGRVRRAIGNPISLIGIALAMVALGNIIFLFFIDLISDHPSPYVGILAYMIAPGILIFGLALALFGAWHYRRKAVHAAAIGKPTLKLDFSDPGQRGAAVFFMTFIVIFVLMSVVGSYRAYEYTDFSQSAKVVTPARICSAAASRVPQRTNSSFTFFASAGKMYL